MKKTTQVSSIDRTSNATLERKYEAVRREVRSWLKRWGLRLGLGIATLALGSCTPTDRPKLPVALNSYYTDEQPALSGDGRFLAFVSNRNGARSLLLYDLKRKQLVNLPRLNRNDSIAETPSLSYTGRYLVYLASDSGRPEIELYDRLTQRTQILTSGYRGWIRNPDISADGRYVVFETGRRGQWDVEILDRGPNIELDRADGS